MVQAFGFDDPGARVRKHPHDAAEHACCHLQGGGVVVGSEASRLVEVEGGAVPEGTAGKDEENAELVGAFDEFVAQHRAPGRARVAGSHPGVERGTRRRTRGVGVVHRRPVLWALGRSARNGEPFGDGNGLVVGDQVGLLFAGQRHPALYLDLGAAPVEVDRRAAAAGVRAPVGGQGAFVRTPAELGRLA